MSLRSVSGMDGVRMVISALMSFRSVSGMDGVRWSVSGIVISAFNVI